MQHGSFCDRSAVGAQAAAGPPQAQSDGRQTQPKQPQPMPGFPGLREVRHGGGRRLPGRLDRRVDGAYLRRLRALDRAVGIGQRRLIVRRLRLRDPVMDACIDCMQTDGFTVAQFDRGRPLRKHAGRLRAIGGGARIGDFPLRPHGSLHAKSAAFLVFHHEDTDWEGTGLQRCTRWIVLLIPITGALNSAHRQL